VNAQMDEIINSPGRQSNYYRKVQEFYEKLSENFDALLTLEEGEKLHGCVLATLNKLPQVKPDLGPVSQKSRRLFGPEKPILELQTASFEKL